MIHWLASYPKSGNTWVRLLLSAYRMGVCSINDNIGTTIGDQVPYHYQSVCPTALTKLSEAQVLAIRPAALLHAAIGSLSKPTIMKTHFANMESGGIRLIPPALSSAAVYLIRDPRDVCVSFARHLNKSIDHTILLLDTGEAQLLDPDLGVPSLLSTWSAHVASWEVAKPTILRYEDLKADPIGGFSEVLATYGIKVEKPRVRKAVRLCEIEKLKAQEAREGFHENGKQERFFGQGTGWENELTEKQARRIVEDHREVMERYGYVEKRERPRAIAEG